MTAPPLGNCLPCEVISAIDGDTLEVEIRIRGRVRLNNCWAPESRTKDIEEKKLGLAAKEYLKVRAVGRRGRVFVSYDHANTIGDLTSLGRVIGDVFLDGADESVSEMMVRNGHASTVKGGSLGE